MLSLSNECCGATGYTDKDEEAFHGNLLEFSVLSNKLPFFCPLLLNDLRK
jgi:hypothetical protein